MVERKRQTSSAFFIFSSFYYLQKIFYPFTREWILKNKKIPYKK
ncbi:hypothetical protein BSI_29060 [Bacillus inaquosorum KCTC 13429]|uniref:Uncharacterized protein n=1 Tax=Bacillus inaquosorum KCTC 13429 TaxID=1236548 RepID=A0A9W5LGW3_9BACI|nr:hypothetical protein BSI_29060 [Bacillus inaquosorum KCTC 13429]